MRWTTTDNNSPINQRAQYQEETTIINTASKNDYRSQCSTTPHKQQQTWFMWVCHKKGYTRNLMFAYHVFGQRQQNPWKSKVFPVKSASLKIKSVSEQTFQRKKRIYMYIYMYIHIDDIWYMYTYIWYKEINTYVYIQIDR